MISNNLNYFIMVIGVITVLVSIILIFLDKLKGEDIYFNIDVKEQEIKKVIEDAEEIISELNYISDVVIQEIEDRIKNLNNTYDSIQKTTSVQRIKHRISHTPIAVKPQKIKIEDAKESIKSDEMEKHNNLTDKKQAIFDYANQGFSITDIAKKLNIGQGEVKLMLSIKKEGTLNE